MRHKESMYEKKKTKTKQKQKQTNKQRDFSLVVRHKERVCESKEK